MEQPAMVFKDVENNGAVWMGMGGIIYRIRCTDDGLVCAPALPGFIYNPESLVTDYVIKDQDVWVPFVTVGYGLDYHAVIGPFEIGRFRVECFVGGHTYA